MALKKLKSRIKNAFSKKQPVFIYLDNNSILNNRVALITGGSSGIGFAIAQSFLKAGAKVVVTGRNEEKLISAINALNSQFPNSAFYLRINNMDVNDFDSALNSAEKQACAPVSILVNNAGITGDGQFPNISENEFDDIISTNLKASYFWAQSFAKYLIPKKMKGNILNIGSSSSFRPAISPYMISKWGIRGITIGLAKALARYGITVNGIAPGPSSTSFIGAGNDNINSLNSPTGRLTTPEEIGEWATKLVSNVGEMTTGHILCLSGGIGVFTFDDNENAYNITIND